MGIIYRILTLLNFLYISGKWLGLAAWFAISASMVWANGFTVLLVSPPDGEVLIGIQLAMLLLIPLVILSVIEWVLFGKLKWKYDTFQNKAYDKSPSTNELLKLGCNQEAIEYLGNPILANNYKDKFGISDKKLDTSIKSGKLKGIIIDGYLWVQDRKI